MTGEELYDIHREEQDRLGVIIDTWSELDETDQEAWEATAARVYHNMLGKYADASLRSGLVGDPQ